VVAADMEETASRKISNRRAALPIVDGFALDLGTREPTSGAEARDWACLDVMEITFKFWDQMEVSGVSVSDSALPNSAGSRGAPSPSSGSDCSA
jgi:hypothetical protein